MTLYVDILFIVNFFITYLLLLVTKLFMKTDVKAYRLIFSSALGGLYSLVILFDELNFFISAIGKLLISVLIVFISFGFVRLQRFLKAIGFFYLSNMVFLGVILGVWLLFKPNGVIIKNNCVYFDISARALLISALLAYLISFAAVKIYNRTIGKNEIYSLTIIKNNQEVHLFAFADTGNKLKEPFSNYPVIIVDNKKFQFEAERLIPFNTVGGDGVLNGFKPDNVIISSGKKMIKTDKVYIALSHIESKDFSAIINPELINF